jgi:Pectate lyase superfamily protein
MRLTVYLARMFCIDSGIVQPALWIKSLPPILTSKSSMNRRAFFKSIALLALATIVPYGLSQTSTEPAIHAESQRLAVFNVRDYGATGEGKALDTSAIGIAIKTASSAGGGRVLFPPGTYLTGTFELVSSVQLELMAGAVILGSRNVADYEERSSRQGKITEDLNVFIPMVAPLIPGPFYDVAMGMAGTSVCKYSGRPRAVFRAQRIEA